MKGTYSVETRSYDGNGDYAEEQDDFDTPEQVRAFIKQLEPGWGVHSVLFYAEGTDSDPKYVTKQFLK